MSTKMKIIAKHNGHYYNTELPVFKTFYFGVMKIIKPDKETEMLGRLYISAGFLNE